jgi:hypothetical protein
MKTMLHFCCDGYGSYDCPNEIISPVCVSSDMHFRRETDPEKIPNPRNEISIMAEVHSRETGMIIPIRSGWAVRGDRLFCHECVAALKDLGKWENGETIIETARDGKG